ncbi:DUF2690 domain-containing protein [Streptomyces sp. NPDC051207]|uniref:helix-turn-helix domain-containing protein n=1 Tax=Streptomyces sp. NPDC051207 TaxID=3154641 RepID=UPI0034403716
MPRWEALPEELDPQMKEFTSRLRRLVDRSGLSIAAVADGTGYSETSWERYLNGRLLAPKGAVVALAEVTGTRPVHLTTMWELAERAWSRSETRHDTTMEAIRISQARAAPGEFGGPPAGDANGGGSGGRRDSGRTARKGDSATASPGTPGPAGAAAPARTAGTPGAAGRTGAAGTHGAAGRTGTPGAPGRAGATGTPGAAGSARVPSVDGGGDAPGGVADARPVNSWGVAPAHRPRPGGRPPGGAPGGWPATGRPAVGGRPVGGPGTAPATGATYGELPRASRPGGAGSAAGGGRRRLTTLLAGVVGVLVVAAGAFFFLDIGGGEGDEGAGPAPSPSATTEAALPPGVKCSGADCTGKDAETMGCSGAHVTTAASATVGTTVVEVRHSKTCGTAWGRVTQAAQGDEVSVAAGGAEQSDSITQAGDTGAYTPMVAVKDAARAKACVTLAATGEKGCTR